MYISVPPLVGGSASEVVELEWGVGVIVAESWHVMQHFVPDVG